MSSERQNTTIQEGLCGLAGTSKDMRIHIALFGRRNVGKSSLLNALTRQNIALVSEVAGTTTDPVEKTMEMLPLGPVLFIDTAGIDDKGALGQARVERTNKVMDTADVAIIATEMGVWGKFEQQLACQLEQRHVPYVIAVTKCDLAPATAKFEQLPQSSAEVVLTSSTTRDGIQHLKDALVAAVPESLLEEPPILCDLIPEGGLAVLVVPVDKEAPKGRLILPQVQTIRDILDGHCSALVVQDTELEHALGLLASSPDIVVTDSQAFAKVASVVPLDVPLTSFSILMARFKGDLPTLVRGAKALHTLQPNDRVLVAESCTHHPICDDIGTVKIPRILNAKVCEDLEIDHCQGTEFPSELSNYKLVIHCGGCMLNRNGMRSRLSHCIDAGVPITNYGMTIAYALGILPRALQPFDDALDIYMQAYTQAAER